MVDYEKQVEVKVCSEEKNRPMEKTEENENIRMSLIYALLFDCLIIFSCISFIYLFYIIGGIFLNPLLIFGSLVIILLFALIETMSLIEKNKLKIKNSDDRSSTQVC